VAKIVVKNVSVSYTLHNWRTYSLKYKLLNFFKKKEGSIESHNALKKISFNLNDGDRLGVLGPNGSGKTTLLKVLSGDIFPTSGAVTVSGKVQSIIVLAAGIRMDMTGLENIVMRYKLYNYSDKEIEILKKKAIEFAELDKFINHPVNTYSSGMILRLAFAIIINMDPDILILDEWILTGDPSFSEKFNQKLEEHIERSKILIFATHNEVLLDRYTNRKIYLE
jgi:ABC-type polysaccharide/polyol phosphate transport system ATPase subunit